MSLDLIRKQHSWFTKGVLIVLAVTFAVGFGFSFSDFGGGSVSQGTAAEVNGEKIPATEFYRARDAISRQFKQESGDTLPEQAANFINIRALNQLIDLKLLAQKAEDLGFRVTDEELNRAITSDPTFQMNGQFVGKQEYENFIEQGLKQSVGEFEQNYRERILAQKLIAFIGETVRITDEELFNLYRMQNEKVNLKYIRFSPQEYLDTYTPSEEEIRNYYEEGRSNFKTPERRKIRYITLGPENFEENIKVSDEEIEAYFEAYSDEFRSDGGMQLPLAEVKEEIKQKIKTRRIEAVRKDFLKNLSEITEDISIERIAKENRVGEINEIGPFSERSSPSSIPPELINKAFSIEQGEKAYYPGSSQVWILEVAKVIQPKDKTLEEAREEIEQTIKLNQAKETARNQAEEALAKAKSEGFEKAAKSFENLGHKIGETDFFSRTQDVPEIESNELKADAFSLTSNNPVAPKVYSSGAYFYVAALEGKREVTSEEFLENKDQLREQEISRQRSNLFSEWLRKLRQQAEIVPNENLLAAQG